MMRRVHGVRRHAVVTLTAFALGPWAVCSAYSAEPASSKSESSAAKLKPSANITEKGGPAKTKKKKKSRTLKELVDLVLSKGADRTLNPDIAAPLGLTSVAATKAIRYSDSVAPDKQEHAFYVVYGVSDEGRKEPSGLVMDIFRSSVNDAVEVVEGTSFYLSMDGLLRGAVEFSGEVDEVDLRRLSVDDIKTKRLFDKEMKFYLNESVSLAMSNQ